MWVRLTSRARKKKKDGRLIPARPRRYLLQCIVQRRACRRHHFESHPPFPRSLLKPILPPIFHCHGHVNMLQQDLLDTLFLNRKALADVDTTQGHRRTITSSSDSSNNPTATTATTTTTMGSDAASAGGSADVCPVDHKSREAWLAQARAAQTQETASASSQPQSRTAGPSPTAETRPTSSSRGWGWRIPFFGSSSTNTQSSSEDATSKTATASGPDLGESRVVSTIPRSSDPGATSAACPVNHETETGVDAKTGNWVYPSEKMFFDAMKRKGHDTRAADMKTVVPIHNAVNERAWVEIKQWEAPYTTTR